MRPEGSLMENRVLGEALLLGETLVTSEKMVWFISCTVKKATLH